MATAIPDSTNLISIEETDFSSSVSEAVFQKLGGGVNYSINTTAGFDSRLDALESLTTFLPLNWVYTTTAQIFNSGGGDISGSFTRRRLWYLVDGVKVFWGAMLSLAAPTTLDVYVQLPNLNIDNAKLELVSGSTYYNPMSFQTSGAISTWNNSNYRIGLDIISGTEVRAFGFMPRIYP